MQCKTKLCFLFLTVLFMSVLVSCSTSKKIAYFPALNDSSFKLVSPNFEPLIQRGDILNIGVSGLDQQAVLFFNNSNTIGVIAGQMNPQNQVLPGFVVSQDGYIDYPKLGQIMALGKTKAELTAEIRKGLVDYIKDPVVNIRFMNYRVTVLGEVARPSTLVVPNERISVLEALGMCGDLTIFGNRKNILLMRTENGIQKSHRINLNDNSLLSSEYYFLQNNDVLYVEPNNARVFAGTEAQAYLPLVLSTLSFLIILFTSFRG